MRTCKQGAGTSIYNYISTKSVSVFAVEFVFVFCICIETGLWRMVVAHLQARRELGRRVLRNSAWQQQDLSNKLLLLLHKYKYKKTHKYKNTNLQIKSVKTITNTRY